MAKHSATEVVGICGGLQILGKKIEDAGAEHNKINSIEGIGLLPISTSMNREKTLTQRTGVHLPSGMDVRGYEIHHGRTNMRTSEAVFRTSTGETCGVESKDGNLGDLSPRGI